MHADDADVDVSALCPLLRPDVDGGEALAVVNFLIACAMEPWAAIPVERDPFVVAEMKVWWPLWVTVVSSAVTRLPTSCRAKTPEDAAIEPFEDGGHVEVGLLVRVPSPDPQVVLRDALESWSIRPR